MSNQKGKRGSVPLATSRTGPQHQKKNSSMSALPPVATKLAHSSQLISPRGSNMSGLTSRDKTVCQYCGVSYLTVAEMRALQGTAKELETQVNLLHNTQTENLTLKQSMKEIRTTCMKDVQKQDEIIKKLKTHCVSLEDQLTQARKELAESVKEANDIREKFEITTDDRSQQEEVISQLRDLLEVKRDEIAVLHSKLIGKKDGDGKGEIQKGKETVSTPESNEVKEKEQIAGNLSSSQIVRMPMPVESKPFVDEKFIEQDIPMEPVRTTDFSSGNEKSMEELKNENSSLKNELNNMKGKYEVSLIRMNESETRLKELVVKYDRLKASIKERKKQVKLGSENNNSVDQKMVADLQESLQALEHQCLTHKLNMEQMKIQYEEKLATTLREVRIERERAESILSSTNKDIETIEKSWEARCAKITSNFSAEQEKIRVSYEKMLQTSKNHEDLLMRELDTLKAKHENSKEEWEKYREQLSDQLSEWKNRYDMKQYEFDELRKAKYEMEQIARENSFELFQLQELVNEADAERKELKTKLAKIEEDLKKQRRLRFKELSEKYSASDLKYYKDKPRSATSMHSTKSIYELKKREDLVSSDIRFKQLGSNFPRFTPSKVPLPPSSSSDSSISSGKKITVVSATSKQASEKSSELKLGRKSNKSLVGQLKLKP